MKSVADNWKDLFESKGCISMILYLRENGPAMKNDIYSNVSRNSSMPARIDALEVMGVVSTVVLRCTYMSLIKSKGALFTSTDFNKSIFGRIKIDHYSDVCDTIFSQSVIDRLHQRMDRSPSEWCDIPRVRR